MAEEENKGIEEISEEELSITKIVMSQIISFLKSITFGTGEDVVAKSNIILYSAYKLGEGLSFINIKNKKINMKNFGEPETLKELIDVVFGEMLPKVVEAFKLAKVEGEI